LIINNINILRSAFNILIPLAGLFLFIACQSSQLTYNLEDEPWTYEAYPGGLSIMTNDSLLAARFQWASRQALEYAHDRGDPVGKWYEAALPNREAFCMRDVSHQSQGAHYLGLADHTKNMLFKFADNVSESKDWCSYWEINRYNQPAPVDYANDQEFWYNLPGNFDVLVACYRQYLITGDLDYLQDPVFVNYYDRTMYDYINAWDLDIDLALNRNRFMNLDLPLDSSYSFHVSRGLPSYGEGEPLRLYLGADLFCLQYQAYQAYEKILRLRGLKLKADSLQRVSQALKEWYNSNWWNSEDNRPLSALLTDGNFKQNPSRYFLQSRIFEATGRQEIALKGLLNLDDTNIESQSYFPSLFYEFDEEQRAFGELLELSDPLKKRREYPEVSYAVVDAMIEGLMGINVDAANRKISTLPRLTGSTSWIRFSQIPVLEGAITVTHKGNKESTIISHLRSEVKWRATFPIETDILWVDDLAMKAQSGSTTRGKETSWVEINLPIGDSVTVRVKN